MFSSCSALLFSRSDLHSLVQPPVNALGNQAMTTADFPLNWSSEYTLPSEPLSENGGALSPTLTCALAVPALAATTTPIAIPHVAIARPMLRIITSSSDFGLSPITSPGHHRGPRAGSKPNRPHDPTQLTRLPRRAARSTEDSWP